MPEPGFDRRFVLVVAVAFAYFLGLGILAPVLPRYVEDVLDGGGTEVGLAVGVFAVSAALLRPWVGRVGDRRGRRVLVVGGSLAAAVSIAGYGLPGGLGVLLVMRLVTGAGEAAAFVGAATSAQDLAPPTRRGQAASFFSISIYGGLAVGPPVGEWVYRAHGPDAAWAVASGACLVATVLALALPRHIPHVGSGPPTGPRLRGLRASLHPAGVGPGVVLALGASSFAGFSSFVPLYVDEIGLDDAGPAFVEYAVIILAIRILGSRLPDVLGARRGPTFALALQAVGLTVMGAWGTPAGLYTATAVYALGVSLLYPSLFPAVVDAAAPEERSQAIATFTLFFDLSQGLGGPLLGTVVALGGERAAFVVAGAMSAIALVVHRRAGAPGSTPPPPAGTAARQATAGSASATV